MARKQVEFGVKTERKLHFYGYYKGISRNLRFDIWMDTKRCYKVFYNIDFQKMRVFRGFL